MGGDQLPLGEGAHSGTEKTEVLAMGEKLGHRSQAAPRLFGPSGQDGQLAPLPGKKDDHLVTLPVIPGPNDDSFGFNQHDKPFP